MPHRQFVDYEGTSWDVWEVRPQAAEEAIRRVREERLGSGSGRAGAAPVNRALEAGWLCFESAREKRRLAPIPERWVDSTQEGLQALCAQATAVRRSRRESEPETGAERQLQ